MKLTGFIIDDEKLAREKLRRLISELNDSGIEIAGEAADGVQAIEMIDAGKPDFIILDIQMPGLTGLEVLRHVNHSPAVIFSTAYDEFAIKAFDVNAVDYLLKPYDQERLAQAVDRMKKRCSAKMPALDESIREALSRALNSRSAGYVERLPVRIGDRIRLVRIVDVLWFDTEDSITFAHTEAQTSDIRYTLEELESRLDPAHFFRAHRSAIVNLDAIAEIIPWFSGKYKIVMSDKKKSEVILARSRAQELKDKLNW